MIEWWRADEAWWWFKNNIIFAMLFFLILLTTLAMTNTHRHKQPHKMLHQVQWQVQCMAYNQQNMIRHQKCVQKNLQKCPLPPFKNCSLPHKLKH